MFEHFKLNVTDKKSVKSTREKNPQLPDAVRALKRPGFTKANATQCRKVLWVMVASRSLIEFRGVLAHSAGRRIYEYTYTCYLPISR